MFIWNLASLPLQRFAARLSSSVTLDALELFQPIHINIHVHKHVDSVYLKATQGNQVREFIFTAAAAANDITMLTVKRPFPL